MLDLRYVSNNSLLKGLHVQNNASDWEILRHNGFE